MTGADQTESELLRPSPRVGAWLVGARGAVATTARLGAAAVAAGLAPPTGLVTRLPAFRDVPLPELDQLVFGGHDVADTPLVKRADALAETGVIPATLPRAVEEELEATDFEIRPGIGPDDTERPREAIARARRDIEGFVEAHGLATVVVVNLASTEPPARAHPAHATLDALDEVLDTGLAVLPPSSLYAYAALDAGCSFVDFTPSTGVRLPALEALALRRGVAHAGRDGKTGETLVKSALAPLFASRNLHVLSWAGTNLLGGGDGAALADPDRRRSKLDSKARALGAILGYQPDARIGIEHVADFGEWKTAWDHISFEGFLGTRMRMQFTWEGCDSALAAPLVLDLARLVASAQAAGYRGGISELAFFFKDPWGSQEHRLAPQFEALCEWAGGLATRA